ncbi:MAG: hypothetical protein BMS9Abin32_074 [Gammaproteobacteria bacterium]|nr:MAG: hypothetical protein BMS9Abin32_074 [Gammaproteobacteria bacterium]
MKVLLLVLTLSIVSCGGSSGDSSGSGGGEQAVKEDKETIFDPMLSTIDKANAVEGINMKAKDDLDRAIDEADPDQ